MVKKSKSPDISSHKRKIVSSKHLATEDSWPLSEVEYAMTIVYNAYAQWMVRCADAGRIGDLAVLDVLILHNINHRGREKRLNDVTFMLNIQDAHTATYSIKKLVKLGLVSGSKRGKEIFYSTTSAGRKACADYAAVREQCLLESLKLLDIDADELVHVATTLRSLSGLYDQASRAAASL